MACGLKFAGEIVTALLSYYPYCSLSLVDRSKTTRCVGGVVDLPPGIF